MPTSTLAHTDASGLTGHHHETSSTRHQPRRHHQLRRPRDRPGHRRHCRPGLDPRARDCSTAGRRSPCTGSARSTSPKASSSRARYASRLADRRAEAAVATHKFECRNVIVGMANPQVLVRELSVPNIERSGAQRRCRSRPRKSSPYRSRRSCSTSRRSETSGGRRHDPRTAGRRARASRSSWPYARRTRQPAGGAGRSRELRHPAGDRRRTTRRGGGARSGRAPDHHRHPRPRGPAPGAHPAAGRRRSDRSTSPNG